MALGLHLQASMDLDDGKLVLAARAGDLRASATLYERYRGKVKGLALRILGATQDVEDVVQDTFVAAFRGLARLNEPQAFSKWLGAITIRTAQRRIRRAKLRARVGMVTMEPDELDAMVTRDAPPDVHAELSALWGAFADARAEGRALMLKRAGYTNDEVATELGVSRATAKRRILLARQLVAARVG